VSCLILFDFGVLLAGVQSSTGTRARQQVTAKIQPGSCMLALELVHALLLEEVK
jgi:hypothetical protein